MRLCGKEGTTSRVTLMYSLAEDRLPKWHFKWGNHGTVSSEGGGKSVNDCPSVKGWQASQLRAALHSQPVVLGFASHPFHQREFQGQAPQDRLGIQWGTGQASCLEQFVVQEKGKHLTHLCKTLQLTKWFDTPFHWMVICLWGRGPGMNPSNERNVSLQ